MEEQDAYIIYVFGYDLLQNKLKQCEYKECDMTFNTLKEILGLYKTSKASHNWNKSLYDTLVEFINDYEFEIDTLLFNELGYKK